MTAARSSSPRPRRARGEGSLHFRRDGRWQIKWVNSEGRRVDRTLPRGTSRATAERLLHQTVADTRECRLVGSGHQRLSDFLTSWVSDIASRTLSPKTAERYEGIVRLYLIPNLGRLRLDQLTPQHIDRLHSVCLKTMSAASVRTVHACLRSALRYAVSRRVLPFSPADGVRAPRAARKRVATLSRGDVHTLLDRLAGHPREAFYGLAVATGARQGELLGLQWQDVDLETGRITIRQSLSRTRTGWALQEPKTPGSRRLVIVRGRTVSALKCLRSQQARKRLKAGEAWSDHSLLFTDDWGEPLYGSHLTEREFKPLLGSLGLPQVPFHSLRHTCATLLLEEGVNPKIVSEMLGHSSVQMTLDTYSHVLPGMQEQVATVMEQALANPGGL